MEVVEGVEMHLRLAGLAQVAPLTAPLLSIQAMVQEQVRGAAVRSRRARRSQGTASWRWSR